MLETYFDFLNTIVLNMPASHNGTRILRLCLDVVVRAKIEMSRWRACSVQKVVLSL